MRPRRKHRGIRTKAEISARTSARFNEAAA